MPLKLVVISAWLSRVITAIVGIFSLRILNAQLPPSEYSIYIIIIGIAGWFSIIGDPGVGYSTQNQISQKNISKESYSLDILNAYILLISLALFICLVIYPMKNEAANYLFDKISLENRNNLGLTLWYSATAFSMTAAFIVSNKFLYPTGKGYIGNLSTSCASIISLLILILGIETSENKIIFSVLSTTLPLLCLSMMLALRQIISSWKSKHLLNLKAIVFTMKNAKGFFIFNLVAAGVVQIDYLVMSQKISSIEIVQYYNIAKIFGIVAAINQALLYAIWPNFTMQFFEKNFKLIKKNILKIAISTAFLTFGTTIFLSLVSNYLELFFQSNTSIFYRKSVIFSFGLVVILRCFVDPYAIFLQSIDKTRQLIIIAAIQAPICILLEWVLSTFFSIEGILLGLGLSSVLTASWMIPYVANRKLANY